MTLQYRCRVGGQGEHWMNLDDTECIWCGPSKLYKDAVYLAKAREASRRAMSDCRGKVMA